MGRNNNSLFELLRARRSFLPQKILSCFNYYTPAIFDELRYSLEVIKFIPDPFTLNRDSCPGSQEKTTSNALTNVSVAIEAGQLIVVGANGSGKSALVRILARLLVYDSTTGRILIDGRPSNEYRG